MTHAITVGDVLSGAGIIAGAALIVGGIFNLLSGWPHIKG